MTRRNRRRASRWERGREERGEFTP